MTMIDPDVRPDALAPRVPVKGEQRAGLLPGLRAAYEQGESVRSIAKRIGRSYGWTHKMLSEAGVRFRQRGGVGK